MGKITLNRKIAESIFNDNAFREELITVLNELIDAELMKSDGEADFDLIDAYSEALNELYNEKDIRRVFWKLQTVEEFMDAVNENKRYKMLKRAFEITAAACAVLALVFAANAVTEKATGYNVLNEVAKAVRSAVTGERQEVKATLPPVTSEPETKPNINNIVPKNSEEDPSEITPTEPETESTTRPHITPQNPDLTEVLSPTEPPTEKETETATRPPFTRPNEEETAPPVIIKLVGEYSESFKRDYKAGEKADFSGLTVKAVYDNGEEKIIPIEACTVRGFSTETPANRIVTVEYEDSSFSFLIRVK